MIIGNGDIASVIKDRDGFCFFACGVSNSLCEDDKEFIRELSTLLHLDHGNRLVYFSTLSIYDKDTPYTQHKIRMENIIRKHIEKYCIVRIGNITWGKNPHTIINTFKRQIVNNEASVIEPRFKYLCSKDEFNYWIDLIPNFNTEMNITGQRLTIQEIYNGVKCGHYD